ncbi:MAG TPA: bacillithiol biosynthesis cysteine-adding enzyme BshC [Puia sp.]|jgi:bacillithiol biosynthesis cysteine-adding enzyme BshC|nr:bacillithiol biosynthesis cysteine-adding enzyme BshC [Puia sp.]
MDWTEHHLSINQTGYFSRIITDYLDQADALRPFYTHPPTAEGLKQSLKARQAKPVDRAVLVDVLREQYAGMLPVEKTRLYIDLLAKENTFTVCTAHQPAIFTGHLYFVYKILHTIRLASWLSTEYPDQHFVPVFWMGSEDADLDELGSIYLGGDTLTWDTKQTGAVGRMKTKGLDKIYYRIEGELSVQPYGPRLLALLKECYLESPDVQTATFRFLHRLFGEYGLIVLIADTPRLKKLMIPVFEDDLFNQRPASIVSETIRSIPDHYKVQANPREINLFYLKDDLRGRIDHDGDQFIVHGSAFRFTEPGMREELHRYPDRFSPNVILRGLFQETVLPNLATIGGGGETAYWLELKALFDHYNVPFPVLILRNSFLLIDRQWREKIDRVGFSLPDLFRPADELVTEIVRRESANSLSLEREISEANRYYEALKALARPVDPSLEQHVEALQAKALDPIRTLEKKLLKAEKRKYGDLQRQVQTLKTALFPADGLQERVENILPWYAQYGPDILRDLYMHSPALDQDFIILTPSSTP